MHKSIVFYLFSCLLVAIPSKTLKAQTIKINEVVSTNSLFEDEDGDTPDWLELRNFTSEAISLNGWQLTDDNSAETHWSFPDISLPADGHLQIWASNKDRGSFSIARTLINQGDIFRYTRPMSAVSNQWTSIDFDDGSWQQASTGIGYGDGDDETPVPTNTVSVFLRKTFTISDPSIVQALIFDVDYDDGFVAYINGVEIARANINGSNPAYNATSPTDREAQMYSGGLPDRFIIDNASDLLQNGDNVLSVQVHNISNTSSDLTIIPFLSAIYSEVTSDGGPLNVIDPLPTPGLHTDFKISSTGETIYLLNVEGIIADSLVIGEIPAGLSFGIPYNNPDALAYFSSPTPAATNDGVSYEGVQTGTVVFSNQGGVVNPFSLELSGATAPAAIRYTLDATLPNENSTLYTGPISINSNTVVRAAIFQTNYLPAAPQSRAYIVENNHDLPIISLITEPDNLFDEDTGMYVLGPDYEENFPHFGANFWEDWERPMHFSFYETNGNLGVELNAGAKIFGGWSRGQDQRSFSIFARSEYGPNEIAYPLFLTRDYDSFQALVLRNAGNDFLNSNMRDRTLTSLMEGAGLDLQANRPAVTYINGEYWGFYNMREKINEHFLASLHNVDPDSIDILEFGGDVVQGSNVEYQQILDFIQSNNLAVDENFDVVAEQIDIENFIIYYAAQIYFDNMDWPGNNIKFWRPANGKWRWVLYDTDFGFGTWNSNNYTNNTLNFALEANGPGWPNPPWSTLLFRNLVLNNGFRNMFVNRFSDEMNSRFIPERVNEHIDTLAEEITSEVAQHYDRWGGDYLYWFNRVQGMRNFSNLRPTNMKQHIRNQFNLVNYRRLTIEIEDTNEGYVRINDRLTIDQNNWEGDYFQGVPFAVVALARPGYLFSHWESSIGDFDDQNLSVDIQTAMTLKPIFIENIVVEMPIVINEINYNSEATHDTGDWIELYNPNDFSIDLSDWILKDSDDEHGFALPAGTLFEANSYLILTRNRNDFLSFYPMIENVIGDFDFGLSSAGDAVRMYNAEMVLQDSVTYLPTNPWPEEANGQGYTLELIQPNLDNSLPENWTSANSFGSPGEANILTATKEPTSLVEFHHYPNPFSSQVNMRFQLMATTQIEAILYDAKGVRIRSLANEQLGTGRHELQTNLDDLPSGMYFLEIRADGAIATSKRWVKL